MLEYSPDNKSIQILTNSSLLFIPSGCEVFNWCCHHPSFRFLALISSLEISIPMIEMFSNAQLPRLKCFSWTKETAVSLSNYSCVRSARFADVLFSTIFTSNQINDPFALTINMIFDSMHYLWNDQILWEHDTVYNESYVTDKNPATP